MPTQSELSRRAIFPKDYCKKQNLPQRRWNSVINKTPLTAESNRSIGGRAPSRYLKNIDDRLSRARTDELLRTHLADPESLRADDFDRFVHDRACRLLDVIEVAMGKPVVGRDSQEAIDAFGAALPRTALAGSR